MIKKLFVTIVLVMTIVSLAVAGFAGVAISSEDLEMFTDLDASSPGHLTVMTYDVDDVYSHDWTDKTIIFDPDREADQYTYRRAQDYPWNNAVDPNDIDYVFFEKGIKNRETAQKIYGYFVPQTTGYYTFKLNATDGVYGRIFTGPETINGPETRRAYNDGQIIVDEFTKGTHQVVSQFDYYLEANQPYPIYFEYFSDGKKNYKNNPNFSMLDLEVRLQYPKYSSSGYWYGYCDTGYRSVNDYTQCFYPSTASDFFDPTGSQGGNLDTSALERAIQAGESKLAVNSIDKNDPLFDERYAFLEGRIADARNILEKANSYKQDEIDQEADKLEAIVDWYHPLDFDSLSYEWSGKDLVLDWDAVEGASFYGIYYGDEEGMVPYPIAYTDDTAFRFDDLKDFVRNDTSINFRVVAYFYYEGRYYGYDWFGEDWLDDEWLGDNWINVNWINANWFGDEWFDDDWFNDYYFNDSWFDDDWFDEDWSDNWFGYWFRNDWHDYNWCNYRWYEYSWFRAGSNTVEPKIQVVLDVSALEKAIEDANKILDVTPKGAANNYSDEQYGFLEDKISDAQAVLDDAANRTQKEIDKATKTLRDVIDWFQPVTFNSLTSSMKGKDIVFDWEDVPGASHYVLYYGDEPYSNMDVYDGQHIPYGTTTFTIKDAGPELKDKYFRVFAWYDYGYVSGDSKQENEGKYYWVGSNVLVPYSSQPADTSALEDVIKRAKAVLADTPKGAENNYSDEQYGFLEGKIADAQAVLDDATNRTQEEIDAATKTLQDVIDWFKPGTFDSLVSRMNGKNIVFDWEDVPGASHYVLYYGDEPYSNMDVYDGKHIPYGTTTFTIKNASPELMDKHFRVFAWYDYGYIPEDSKEENEGKYYWLGSNVLIPYTVMSVDTFVPEGSTVEKDGDTIGSYFNMNSSIGLRYVINEATYNPYFQYVFSGNDHFTFDGLTAVLLKKDGQGNFEPMNSTITVKRDYETGNYTIKVEPDVSRTDGALSAGEYRVILSGKIELQDDKSPSDYLPEGKADWEFPYLINELKSGDDFIAEGLMIQEAFYWNDNKKEIHGFERDHQKMLNTLDMRIIEKNKLPSSI